MTVVVCSLKSSRGVNVPHLIMNQFRWLSRVVDSKVCLCIGSSETHFVSRLKTFFKKSTAKWVLWGVIGLNLGLQKDRFDAF